MVCIYKTSHKLQHNFRKTPNTQFKVGKLRQLFGFIHNLYSNWIHQTKGHFAKITTIPENAQVAQRGDSEPVVTLRKQHDHVKPAISEYEGTVRDWWAASLAKGRLHKSRLFSTLSYLREATWSQCTKASILLYSIEGVHHRSLADWRRPPPPPKKKKKV